jgi:hypothetical protein
MGSFDRRPEAHIVGLWREALRASQEDAARGDYAQAIARLEQVLLDASAVADTATERLLPRTWGLLGTWYYHSGDHDRGRAITAEARDYCERIGDREGVETYTRNLSVMDLS